MQHFETSARELATVFKGDRKMLEYTLEGLFHIAKADDVLHPAEEKFLHQVATQLGFTNTHFMFMKALNPSKTASPYDVLGGIVCQPTGAYKPVPPPVGTKVSQTNLWRAVYRRSLSSSRTKSSRLSNRLMRQYVNSAEQIELRRNIGYPLNATSRVRPRCRVIRLLQSKELPKI